MDIAAHSEKISRLIDLKARLHPIHDFELWYWACLTAGTNMWNASLHATGLTPPDRVFSTIPGVHVVPQADGSFRRELREPGDVSHVGWPAIGGVMPPPLTALEAALHALEAHRDPCLRGMRQPTDDIIDECDTAFSCALANYQILVKDHVSYAC